MLVGIIIHSDKNNEGIISRILESEGIDFELIKIYKSGQIEGEYTHLIITGGSMGAYEEDKYPYLRTEKAYIRDFLSQGGYVFGICLGAQILADTLGGQVYPYIKERGWVEIRKIAQHPICKNLPETLKVFQWHGDTFDLPPGSTLLYEGDTVKNQFFVLKNAIGVQFHPEVTLETIKEWSKDLQNDEERRKLIDESTALIDELHELCKTLLLNFLIL